MKKLDNKTIALIFAGDKCSRKFRKAVKKFDKSEELGDKKYRKGQKKLRKFAKCRDLLKLPVTNDENKQTHAMGLLVFS